MSGSSGGSAPIGVLVAAGRGRRLGGRKQFVSVTTPKGDMPLVAAAFDAIGGSCASMIVVVGHESDAVVRALGPRTFRLAQGAADGEMLDSIRAGLRAAQDAAPSATVLLHPADHPHIDTTTLARLLETHRGAAPGRAVMPEHAGRGGHPVLIPPALVERILAAPITGGLRQYWTDHPESCVRICVDDPAAVRDIDEPKDLA